MKQMKGYLFTFVIAASCLAQLGQSYDGGFSKLDNLLTESPRVSEDVDANIELAKELLKTEGKKMFNGDLAKAIKLFTALAEAECDAAGFKTMSNIDEATDRIARSKQTSQRKLDRVLLFYAIKHAANCQNIYPIRLKAKLNSMNEEMISRVNTLTDKIIEVTKPLLGSYSSAADYAILSAFNGECKGAIWTRENLDTFGSATLDAIELSAGLDEDIIFTKPVAGEKGSRAINKEKLNLLFKKYVIEPCEYYYTQLEADIFTPAAYDSEVYSNYDETHQNLEWFTNWYRFRTCKRITKYASESLFDAVLNNAKRRR